MIRRLEQEETEKALRLVWQVFLEYEANDYMKEGIDEFDRTLHDEGYVSGLIFYGAFKGDELTGVIATRNEGSHIALFFVDGKHQGKGIGKSLFEKALEEDPKDYMIVNSSPYAVEIYHRLGFEDTDAEQEVRGLRFTPMKYHK